MSELTADIMTYLRQTVDKITKGLPPPPQEPTPDKGAGPYGTEQATPSDVMEALKLRALALGGDPAGLPDAARNLNHFLDNTGEDLVLDPDRIAADVPTFKQNTEAQAQAEINKVARDAAARGEYGKPLPFTTGWDGTYLTKEQSENWY